MEQATNFRKLTTATVGHGVHGQGHGVLGGYGGHVGQVYHLLLCLTVDFLMATVATVRVEITTL